MASRCGSIHQNKTRLRAQSVKHVPLAPLVKLSYILTSGEITNLKQIKFIHRCIAALVISVGYILASSYLLVSNTEYPTTIQVCCLVNSIASGSCCCCKTTTAPLLTSPCLLQAPGNSDPANTAFYTTSDNKQLATTYTIAPALTSPISLFAMGRPHPIPHTIIPSKKSPSQRSDSTPSPTLPSIVGHSLLRTGQVHTVPRIWQSTIRGITGPNYI